MQLTKMPRDVGATVFEHGAAALMARIVDRNGRCVPPDQVAAIRYCIYELRSRGRNQRKALAGHEYRRLEVDEVLLDYLETESWSLDVAGYNFRHVLLTSSGGTFPKRGSRYEILYVFTPGFGAPIVIRFFVRIVSK
jgi:hypothetical protein